MLATPRDFLQGVGCCWFCADLANVLIAVWSPCESDFLKFEFPPGFPVAEWYADPIQNFFAAVSQGLFVRLQCIESMNFGLLFQERTPRLPRRSTEIFVRFCLVSALSLASAELPQPSREGSPLLPTPPPAPATASVALGIMLSTPLPVLDCPLLFS